MKSRIQEKIQEIEHTADQIRLAAGAAVKERAKAQEAQEDMRREHWRQRKETATLSRSADEFAALQDENQHLRESLGRLRTALQTLLANIKTLRNEFHS